MSKRDPTIELYRILLMFGICLFHAVNSCGHQNLWISQSLSACVNAFAMLSGYFGIRFSWKKVVRLYGTGLYAAFVSTALLFLVDGKPWSMTFVADSLAQLSAYWFLHAYVFLMFLAPLIEMVFSKVEGDRRGAVKKVLPLLVLVFGWSFLKGIRPISAYIPTTAGLGSFSGITLAGAYVIGRLMGAFGIFSRVSVKCWLAIFVSMCVVIPRHFPGYDSPFIMALAVSSFCLFKSNVSACKSPRLCRLINLIAPSCFAIYLLHCNDVGLRSMKGLEDFVCTQCHSALLAYLVTGAVAFAAAFLLDLPRRIAVRGLCVAAQHAGVHRQNVGKRREKPFGAHNSERHFDIM